MHSKLNGRRRHSEEFKARVVAECALEGASVAAVAQAHGVNANLVHKWRRAPSSAPASTVTPQTTPASATGFVPVALPPRASSEIKIEVRRGATTIIVTWPVQAGADCAAWMREWLR